MSRREAIIGESVRNKIAKTTKPAPIKVCVLGGLIPALRVTLLERVSPPSVTSAEKRFPSLRITSHAP